MKIIDLQPDHAPDSARLHVLGQPGTFLTNLGPNILTLFYNRLPQSAGSFGFAMVEETNSPQMQDAMQADNSTFLGFIAATTSTGRLFFDLGTRHLLQFLPQLCRRYVQQPKLVWQSMQTLYYPFMQHTPATDYAAERTGEKHLSTTAELLALMVEPAHQNRGIGQQLLHTLFAACRQRGIEGLGVTVDAKNSGARRFYERHGFIELRTFTLYGRQMCYYRKALTA